MAKCDIEIPCSNYITCYKSAGLWAVHQCNMGEGGGTLSLHCFNLKVALGDVIINGHTKKDTKLVKINQTI